MRSDETPGKDTAIDQGKYSNPILSGWDHEREICKWPAAGKTGTGIRKI